MVSNAQQHLSVSLPVLAIFISLLIQMQTVHAFRLNLDKRMDGLDSRMDRLHGRMDRFKKRMDRFEDMLSEMRTTFIKDPTERIVRLESSVFRG